MDKVTLGMNNYLKNVSWYALGTMNPLSPHRKRSQTIQGILLISSDVRKVRTFETSEKKQERVSK